MKIFVSYSRNDAQDFANQVHESLLNKHEVFVDIKNIRLGESWDDILQMKIFTCDIFVVIVTHAALTSPEVEREVLQAQGLNKKIIPCFFRNVNKNNIKWNLYRIQGIDFSDKYELVRNLYSKIEMGVGKPVHKRTYIIYYPESEAAKALFDQANNLSSQDLNQEAIECYEKALAIEPNNFVLLFNLGAVYYKLGKYWESASCYNKIGIYYYYNHGKYDEATGYFDKALRIEPNFTPAKDNKKLALEKIKAKRDKDIHTNTIDY